MAKKKGVTSESVTSTTPPPAAKPPRKIRPELVVPDAVDGIQINFCKNPSCANFGMPAEGVRSPGGRPKKNTVAPPPKIPAKPLRYKPAGISGSGALFIQCQSCGECPPIKSNQGIKEELDRISAYLEQSSEPLYCQNEECDNHKNRAPLDRESYWMAGKTSVGSQRWQCKLCLKTVAIPRKPTSGQKKSHENIAIFRNLMNKMPLGAIARANGISMKTVYDKIDFIYNQCVAFVAHRERELPNLKKKWMEISVDRQEHLINWYKSDNKKTSGSTPLPVSTISPDMSLVRI
jgi:transposase-like protein